jgi:hypothetical protein
MRERGYAEIATTATDPQLLPRAGAEARHRHEPVIGAANGSVDSHQLLFQPPNGVGTERRLPCCLMVAMLELNVSPAEFRMRIVSIDVGSATASGRQKQ